MIERFGLVWPQSLLGSLFTIVSLPALAQESTGASVDSYGPEDIALAAQMLVPRLDELLDRAPEWRGRMSGIMQLVTLVEIDQALRERTWR